jgi:hypothetical protein
MKPCKFEVEIDRGNFGYVNYRDNYVVHVYLKEEYSARVQFHPWYVGNNLGVL